jgi:hypothetical protein
MVRETRSNKDSGNSLFTPFAFAHIILLEPTFIPPITLTKRKRKPSASPAPAQTLKVVLSNTNGHVKATNGDAEQEPKRQKLSLSLKVAKGKPQVEEETLDAPEPPHEANREQEEKVVVEQKVAQEEDDAKEGHDEVKQEVKRTKLLSRDIRDALALVISQ